MLETNTIAASFIEEEQNERLGSLSDEPLLSEIDGRSIISVKIDGLPDENEQAFNAPSDRALKSTDTSLTSFPENTLGRRGLSAEQIANQNREASKLLSQDYIDELSVQRSELVKRKFRHGLSESEERKLVFISWQLDRYDDAISGDALDNFEKIIEEQEFFATQIDRILMDLKPSTENRQKSHKRGPKRR